MTPKPPQSTLRLRSVFISDVHLGFKGCRAEFLLDFLRRHWDDLDEQEQTNFTIPLKHRRHHRHLLQEHLAGGPWPRGAVMIDTIEVPSRAIARRVLVLERAEVLDQCLQMRDALRAKRRGDDGDQAVILAKAVVLKRVENLPRIRDVVDQQLAALRNTVQRPEEAWVNDPANAWRMQQRPPWLAAASFMTRSYNALRLRWQLKDAAPEDAPAVAAFMTQLAQAGQGLERSRLKDMLSPGKAPGWEALSPSQRALMTEALRDLDLSLADMPDASLGADFSTLALALRDDLALPAATALARLDAFGPRDCHSYRSISF